MSEKMQTEIGPTDSTTLYKNATRLSQPILDHKRLQFIRAHNDERILLGACNLNGRFWNGSAWLYEDSSSFDKSRAVARATAESGVRDAVFLDAERFFVVEDSGVVRILGVVDDAETGKKDIRCLGYACRHDDAASSASVSDNKTRVVTAGADRCIKVWDTTNLLAERSYEGAHGRTITCVDVRPRSNDEFASCALDCEALVWDTRERAAARVAYSYPGRRLTAVAWCPDDDNVVIVGSIDGRVTMIDLRKPGDVVTQRAVYRRPIHRLEFHPKRSRLLATCSDGTELEVLDAKNNFAGVYRDERHDDFVRGIAWYNEDLLSCAWDNTVLRHRVVHPLVDDE